MTSQNISKTRTTLCIFFSSIFSVRIRCHTFVWMFPSARFLPTTSVLRGIMGIIILAQSKSVICSFLCDIVNVKIPCQFLVRKNSCQYFFLVYATTMVFWPSIEQLHLHHSLKFVEFFVRAQKPYLQTFLLLLIHEFIHKNFPEQR